MKKLLSLLLALLMIASVVLVACGDDETPDDEYNNDLTFDTLTPATQTLAPVSSDVVTEAPTLTFTDVNEQVYVKNCVEVNLRQSPDADSKLKGSLSFGDGKTYTRVKYSEDWSGLDIDGEILYVRTKFLTTDDDFVVFTPIDKTIYAVNTVSKWGVKVYNFTDTEADGAEFTTVKHNAALHATGISADENWYRIDLTYTEDGKEVTVKNLYIYNGKYVSETMSSETAPLE